MQKVVFLYRSVGVLYISAGDTRELAHVFLHGIMY